MRKIAYVKWVDSTSTKKIAHGGSLDLDYIENAGIIVDDTPELITLAFYSNWDKDHYTETLTIPKVAVKKIRRYRIPEE